MTLKIAVFAPIPSASVSTATPVKPGFFSNWRKANLRSFITQRLHRIDSRRASRGKQAGQQRDRCQHENDGDENARLCRTDTKELMAEQPRQPKRGDKSGDNSGPDQS